MNATPAQAGAPRARRRWRRWLLVLLAAPVALVLLLWLVVWIALPPERMVPLVLQEGTFPIIGGVTQDFLLQMQHDGSSPTLHDLASLTPRDDVAAQHPEEFQRLQGLTRGLHESARLMLFKNVRE